ncbi:DUF2238 domain-containing protein [Rubripirellula reticaptiva]|uniref:Inner membrane protein YjdF n=1 Tax=Rubripirellula reticaptiva TaxID=2528013 RepID=A0A5C6F4R1_9BACT|nr:DUF2238 domain-containing protein [Rubripirellula reticaptiva]TWU56185.1 Inner membrane protein YjdF [Rubripirellula reticaptiva]
MKFQFAVLFVTAITAAASFWDAPYPEELKLQHGPTLLILVGMASSSVWFRMSNLSFTCIIAFLMLHIIGARWIYSFVPYDKWTDTLFGIELTQHFGWQRNHYDRLVHFASGLLLTPPASELVQRAGRMRPCAAAVTSIAVVLAVGAIYEILEWQIATFFSPAAAESYNGQQGDVWDPQKDMALAWFGAVIAAVIVFRCSFDPIKGQSVSS